MQGTTASVFGLLPSVQQREESLAPIAFMPAVRVRVEVEDRPATDAIVDTAAQMSVASRQMLSAGLETPIVGPIRMKELGNQNNIVQLVKTSLTLCDRDFSPTSIHVWRVYA